MPSEVDDAGRVGPGVARRCWGISLLGVRPADLDLARSMPTSQSVTPLRSCRYSPTASPYWLGVVGVVVDAVHRDALATRG
jgi:hypothetical protein